MGASKAKEKKKRKRDLRVQEAREAAAEKERKREAYAAVARDALQGKTVLPFDRFEQNEKGTGYEFWTFHVLNCLGSSLESGLWTPLFPEIYQGVPGRRELLYKRIVERHYDPEAGILRDAGVQSVIWMAMTAREMFPLVWKLRTQVRRQGGDPHRPMDGVTWTLVHAMGQLMRHHCAQWDALQAHTWEIQSMFRDTIRDANKGVNALFSAVAGEEGTGETRDRSPGT